MRSELQEALVRDFPKLFSGRNLPVTQNLMSFGCECGDGWEPIIRDFCETAMHVLQNEHEDNWPMFVQIKEKYGTLRLYMSSYLPALYGPEYLAELVSARTCELCGAKGKINEGGWLSCRCDYCR